MNKIHQSIAVLVLVLVGLMGCGFEPRVVGDANPARVAEMQQTLRDLWVGHIFWVRHVVSNIATNDPEERDAAMFDTTCRTQKMCPTQRSRRFCCISTTLTGLASLPDRDS